MTKQLTIGERAMIHASGNVLTDLLPDDYESWEDEELYEYCEDCAWEPYEYMDGKFIFEEIIAPLAFSFERFHREESKL